MKRCEVCGSVLHRAGEDMHLGRELAKAIPAGIILALGFWGFCLLMIALVPQ
jgi:hypothetical protein